MKYSIEKVGEFSVLFPLINFRFVFTELAARENSEQARVQRKHLKSELGKKLWFSRFMFGNYKDKNEAKKKKTSPSQHQRDVVAVKTIKGKGLGRFTACPKLKTQFAHQ